MVTALPPSPRGRPPVSQPLLTPPPRGLFTAPRPPRLLGAGSPASRQDCPHCPSLCAQRGRLRPGQVYAATGHRLTLAAPQDSQLPFASRVLPGRKHHWPFTPVIVWGPRHSARSPQGPCRSGRRARHRSMSQPGSRTPGPRTPAAELSRPGSQARGPHRTQPRGGWTDPGHAFSGNGEHLLP